MGGVRHKRAAERRTLILDATPIIYLCKSGIADELRQLASSFRLVTTDEVYHEVYVKGIQMAVTESGLLKDLFEGRIIEVRAPREGARRRIPALLSPSSGVDEGESSVISLAVELDATAVIDDRRARNVARVLGVRLSGTPAILIELVKVGRITKAEAERALERMVEQGWYCDAGLFSRILKTIRRV